MYGHRPIAVLLMTGAVIALAGCSSAHQSAPDPSGDKIHNIIDPYVVTNVDGFRNVVIGCDGLGDMLFVTSRGQSSDAVTSGIFVIANDPRCTQKHN